MTKQAQDVAAAVTKVVENHKKSGKKYPIPEKELIKEVAQDSSASESDIRKALVSSSSLAAASAKSNGPTFVTLAEDEALIYGIDEAAVMKALKSAGGTAYYSALARKMGLPTSGPKWKCLRDELGRLLDAGTLYLRGNRVSLEPPLDIDERIIEALGALKDQRKYPALPGEIATKIALPKSRLQELKKTLSVMAKTGVLTAAKRGRYGAYMLGGDDPRYAKKPDNKLKFELLEEIEELRARVAEMQSSADLMEVTEADAIEQMPKDLSKVEEALLREIRMLSRKLGKRTLDLWEIREGFAKIPQHILNQILERLGSAWKIELQPVHDAGRLNEKQKAALLKLSDGTLIGAIAPVEE
jgi:hypothetical protein